jgi:hypothetical protein
MILLTVCCLLLTGPLLELGGFGAGRLFLAGLAGGSGAIMGGRLGAGGEADRLADSSDLAGEMLRPPRLSLLMLPSHTLCTYKQVSYNDCCLPDVTLGPFENILTFSASQPFLIHGQKCVSEDWYPNYTNNIASKSNYH